MSITSNIDIDNNIDNNDTLLLIDCLILPEAWYLTK